MATLNDATVKDALLIVWDVCTDLTAAADGDPSITAKLDQLRRCINAMDVPKAAATKSREMVDASIKAEREAAKT